MQANIISIAIGNIKQYTDKNKIFSSAYKKDTFFNYAHIDSNGIKGDVHADKIHHGGEDKAVLIASSNHYKNNKILEESAMGENILIDTYDEQHTCIGDIYTMGDIIIEVSQPRQPCWKIGKIYSKKTFQYIVNEEATGWYARVLQGGILDKNDPYILKNRVSNITIKSLSFYLKKPPKGKALIEEILSLQPLANAYKDSFNKALKSRQT